MGRALQARKYLLFLFMTAAGNTALGIVIVIKLS